MKRYIVFFMLFISVEAVSQGVYSMAIEGINGVSYNLSLFKGKKILVVGFNAGSPGVDHLDKLDSLYKTNISNLIVLGLPIMDMNGSMSDSSLIQLLQQQHHITFLIAKPIKGTKASGIEQSSFAKWLTNGSENGHYNNDFLTDGQMFLINERGTLFGSFRKGTPLFIINRAIGSSGGQ